ARLDRLGHRRTPTPSSVSARECATGAPVQELLAARLGGDTADTKAMTPQDTRGPRPEHGANRKPGNLALQGRGPHGAWAWGVLDRLAEDGRLAIDAISATSAGAMNAVVFAYGMALGGPDGARQKLGEFWQQISEAGNLYSPVRSFPWEQWLQANG